MPEFYQKYGICSVLYLLQGFGSGSVSGSESRINLSCWIRIQESHQTLDPDPWYGSEIQIRN
jgi:hypothetical protein